VKWTPHVVTAFVPHFCITAAIEPSGSVELVAGPATMEKPAVGAENFCSTGWLAAMLLAL
jgi:hypothetical protein